MIKRFIVVAFWVLSFNYFGFAQTMPEVDMNAFHEISSHDLLGYAAELSTEKYGGRLSGSPGYEMSARWVAGLLHEWGLKPGVGDTSYFQWFPNAWTDVLETGNIRILPVPGTDLKERVLNFPDDFFPGSNSATGNVAGEVVYVGFGISAPELGYDDYAGIDVKGKILLMETGVPYTANDPELKKWEPYSYHRYKFQKAKDLGAAGLLYVGLVANPNTSYIEGFVNAHISEEVADELVRPVAKRPFVDLKKEIVKEMKPVSFSLNRIVEISARTKHYPDAMSCNVVGYIEGTDPLLKEEVIIIGAHLDGQGSPGALFPSTLDNASGVADLLGAAKALASSTVKPARSVMFLFFGGEECGLYGSIQYVNNPQWPKDKTLFMMNLDMVGNGKGFFLGGGLTHPDIYSHFEIANNKYLHRELRASEVRPSFGRPRTDGAVFEKGGYPVLSLWTTQSVKPVYYHHPKDDIDAVTPEIMEDAAKLLYLGILGAANDRN